MDFFNNITFIFICIPKKITTADNGLSRECFENKGNEVRMKRIHSDLGVEFENIREDLPSLVLNSS